ncbi:DUF6502 family protein [Polaromonas sp. P2-4]|nr:DUF6502 family protein [Polaromonas sp. P2-4]
MPSPDAPTATPSPAFVLALRRVLRPLVRLMLARGVTLPYLTELLKALMVEVADKEFRIGAKAPTDSRVSLVTGVHRKDVSRLRQAMDSSAEIVPSVVSLGAQLVAVWLGSPRYLDEEGRPKPLPRFVSEGGELSFEGLVASVNSDIRSRVVLDEWRRLGVVHFDDERRVCLNAAAFVPAAGFDEKAFYLGHNLHDHAAAAAHNLLGGQPAFLERSVHYDALSPGSIQLLARQSEEFGMKALLALNKSAAVAEQKDTDDTTPRQRMTFGIYFYAEPTELGAGAPSNAAGTPPNKGEPA